MPVSKYFGGSGDKVMSSMKKTYGEDKGKQVFYATANKKKGKKKSIEPSDNFKKKHGV